MELLTVVLLGLPTTLLVTAGAFLIGAVLGVPLALLAQSPYVVVRGLFRLVIDLLRGVPPIVVLFLIYFGLAVDVIQFSSLQAAVIGLGLIASGYMAENYRGGFLAVGRGQWEAGHALGLSTPTMTRWIIAPQAFRVALPSITTYLIGLLKDSSIASTIGVAEIVYGATQFTRQNHSGLTVFFVAALVYLALSIPLGLLSRKWDAKLREKVSR